MVILIAVGTPRKLAPLLVGLVLFYGYISWQQFTHPHKRPFRDLAAYVQMVVSPQDLLINYNGQAHHLWETKYYGLTAPIYTPNGPLPFYTGTAQMTAADTIAVLPQVPRIGVISSEPVAKVILPGYKLSSLRQFGELSFSWWMLQ